MPRQTLKIQRADPFILHPQTSDLVCHRVLTP